MFHGSMVALVTPMREDGSLDFDALRRLVGMYAFVAVDVTNGDFLAARDPFGVKPLYLINTGPGFLFCSEIRPLLSAAETGDVLLLPPGYLLTRMQCLPYDSAIAPSIVRFRSPSTPLH